jgi:hypothetical protein
VKNVFQPASIASPGKRNLFPPGNKVRRLTPKSGSEVEGVQLSWLNDDGKNELALNVVRGELSYSGYTVPRPFSHPRVPVKIKIRIHVLGSKVKRVRLWESGRKL